ASPPATRARPRARPARPAGPAARTPCACGDPRWARHRAAPRTARRSERSTVRPRVPPSSESLAYLYPDASRLIVSRSRPILLVVHQEAGVGGDTVLSVLFASPD